MGDIAVNNNGIQPCPKTEGDCLSWVVTSTLKRNLFGFYICSFAFCLIILLTLVALAYIMIRLRLKKSILGAAAKSFVAVTFVQLLLIWSFGVEFIRQGNTLLAVKPNELVIYLSPDATFMTTKITGINVLPDVCDLASNNLCVCDDIYRLKKEISEHFTTVRRPHFTKLHKEYSCLADALNAPLNSFFQFHNYFSLLGLSILQFILVVNMLSNFWSELVASQKEDMIESGYKQHLLM